MPKRLDQFFTHPDVAARCWRRLLPVLRKLTGKTKDELFFIEPSAGDGAFYDLFPGGKGHCLGMDLAPRRPEFIRGDFLQWNYRPRRPRKNVVIVGNPPFGTRGDLAIRFVNKAATLADTVAFIVPVIFRKYLVHKKITKGLRLVHATDLRRDAFWTDQKERYAVNTEFQVWTRLDSSHEDMRLFSAPPIRHRDFEMWQYNNTREALKVFRNDFDFAVPCQGWQDYTRRETDAKKCEKKKQWILFGPRSTEVKEKLDRIDYAELAMRSATAIPGFRKGDVVREYIARHGD